MLALLCQSRAPKAQNQECTDSHMPLHLRLSLATLVCEQIWYCFWTSQLGRLLARDTFADLLRYRPPCLSKRRYVALFRFPAISV